jgi:hypothetical protein
LEVVSEDLGRALRTVASEPDNGSLREAFAAARESDSHIDTVGALKKLRVELTHNNIQPTPTLLISLTARVLQPGSSAESDRFLARALEEWETAEENLGVDIDARVFALVKSSDSRLDQSLHLNQVVDPGNEAGWRYGVLSGMFWPRGAQIRGESNRAWNPFERSSGCDRLLVLASLSRVAREVMLSSPRWFEEIAELLVRYGSAELVGEVDKSNNLATALLRIGAQPVDSDALLIHARLTGIRREGKHIVAEIELPEAFQ